MEGVGYKLENGAQVHGILGGRDIVGTIDTSVRPWGKSGNGKPKSKAEIMRRYLFNAPDPRSVKAGGMSGEVFGGTEAVRDTLIVSRARGTLPGPGMLPTKQEIADLTFGAHRDDLSNPYIRLWRQEIRPEAVAPVIVPTTLEVADPMLQEIYAKRWWGGGTLGHRSILQWMLGRSLPQSWLKVTVVPGDSPEPRLTIQVGSPRPFVDAGEYGPTVGVAAAQLDELAKDTDFEELLLTKLAFLSTNPNGGFRTSQVIRGFKRFAPSLKQDWMSDPRPVSHGPFG